MLHEDGTLVYPYSVRELILVARRLNTFGSDSSVDDLSCALRDVFDGDSEDRSANAAIAEVLSAHSLHGLAHAVRQGQHPLGAMDLKLSRSSTNVGRQLGEEHTPPPMPETGPTHGEWDGKQHTGGNRFAGGSGGTGTAGLGGRAGPYRLDVGQEVHLLTEAEKAAGVSQESLDAAKQLADEAYARRLQEIGLAAHDAAELEGYLAAVAPQVVRMQRLLREHRVRGDERVWLKARQVGELDQTRLVDGVAGSTAIYKHRGVAQSSNPMR